MKELNVWKVGDMICRELTNFHLQSSQADLECTDHEYLIILNTKILHSSYAYMASIYLSLFYPSNVLPCIVSRMMITNVLDGSSYAITRITE